MHSYYQVLSGFVYSFLYAYSIYIGYKQLLVEKKRNVYLVTGVTLCWFLLGVLVFLFRDPELETIWDTNYYNQCDGQLNLDHIMQNELLSASTCFIFYGLYIGFYLLKDKTQYSFSWKSCVAGGLYLALAIFLYGLAKDWARDRSEYVVKLLLVILLRGLFGFVLGYFLPYLHARTSKSKYVSQINERNELSLR